jgi:hypothetical protein
MADYFLNNIPADEIIPWDFNAPLVPARPADTSAAMIAVNGLLLLAKQEQSIVPASQSGVSHYFHAAIQVHPTPYHIRLEAFTPSVDFKRHNKCILGTYLAELTVQRNG